MILEMAGCPTRSSLAAPENEPVSTTRTSTSIAVKRSMVIPPRNVCYRSEQPPLSARIKQFKHRQETEGGIMKFNSDSAGAFGQVDIVVDNAGVPNLAPLTPWHKDRPAAGRAAAMLAFAAGFLVAALGARAAGQAARPHPSAERAGTDSVRVQPKQFAQPNQPDVSASEASDIDKLY